MAPINTDLLRELLPPTGVPTQPGDTPPATSAAPNNAAALASLGQLVLTAIPFALMVLITYGIGIGAIYILRQIGANVPPQPWWGPLVFGGMVSLLGGPAWRSKK